MQKIETSNAKCEDMIVLSDEDSLWGTNPNFAAEGQKVDF